jgi:hypothetical protein
MKSIPDDGNVSEWMNLGLQGANPAQVRIIWPGKGNPGLGKRNPGLGPPEQDNPGLGMAA